MKNGIVVTIGHYNENGKETSEWQEFDDNGILERIKNYENGQRKGEWKYYDQKGTLIKTENY